MTNKTELMACPCCEGEAKEMYTPCSAIRWIACLKCGLETKGFGNAEAAEKAWNTRVAPAEDVRAVVEEPVAWRSFDGEGGYDFTDDHETGERWLQVNGPSWVTPLFDHPPRPAVPVIDFNEEILLPCPADVRPGFCGDLKLSFDGAEYRGRAWLMEQGGNEEWVAIEGPENARKAGEALIAWAEAWENKT